MANPLHRLSLNIAARSLWDGRALLAAAFLIAFAVIVPAPYVITIVKSFATIWRDTWWPEKTGLQAYEFALILTDVPAVLGNSVIIALLATAISTAIAIPTAWALAKRPVPFRLIVITMLLLPRLIPPLAFAVGTARLFYDLNLIDTHIGVALAHVTVLAPYSILLITAAFAGIDDRLLEAGRVCGAKGLQLFFYIILPLAAPGILASMVFTFAFSYNELELSMLTYGPDTQTLTVQAFNNIAEGFLDVAAAVSVMLSIPAILILLMLQHWIRPERLTGGFKGS
ncbi:MAG: ABC transporter permease subunit [Pseudomonadota bacterium]